MLKAGFAGSGINDVVWMGDVMNQASKLCHQGAKNGRMPIQVSESVHACLNQRVLHVNGEEFLQRGIIDAARGEAAFQCDVVNVIMDRYLDDQQFKASSTDMLAEILSPKTTGPYPMSHGIAGLLYPSQGQAQSAPNHSLAEIMNALGKPRF